MSYPHPDHDWFGYPPHQPPSYLTELGKRIFRGIQAELVQQGKKATIGNSPLSGDGYVVYRQDKHGHVLLDCEINLIKVVERIEKVIKDYEDSDARPNALALPVGDS
ncbi:MAG TPA: hypothetical protein VH164_01120 [Ktedonobacteraceae bacterium]|jgi:hypothetical protein|nr:hypothetical protein [Ktedonobacteraceae bacterium]